MSLRAPGTQGETRTIDYLVETFRSLGLEPGGAKGSWGANWDLRGAAQDAELFDIIASELANSRS